MLSDVYIQRTPLQVVKRRAGELCGVSAREGVRACPTTTGEWIALVNGASPGLILSTGKSLRPATRGPHRRVTVKLAPSAPTAEVDVMARPSIAAMSVSAGETRRSGSRRSAQSVKRTGSKSERPKTVLHLCLDDDLGRVALGGRAGLDGRKRLALRVVDQREPEALVAEAGDRGGDRVPGVDHHVLRSTRRREP